MNIIFLHLLIGCGAETDTGKDVDPKVTIHDYDNDGFNEVEGDCDDEDASINPDVEELCDGIDNNCDGEVDNGVLATYYEDEDGDGFGNAARFEEVCAGTQSEGFIEDSSDCNDLDASINPMAQEICDDLDNDCDELVDKNDDDFDQDSAKEFYEDVDGDGYYTASASAEPIIACSTPEGYSDTSGDCNDANELISPDAIEICDEVDNDCDYLIDDADNTLNLDSATTFYLDADGDGFGALAFSEQACVQPNNYVLNSEDCNDLDNNSYPAADETCDEADNDCDGDIDEESVDAQQYYLDVDGDGYGVSEDIFPATVACSAPNGYSEFDTDCDDGDALVNPEKRWYADFDGDGNGFSMISVQSCEQPGGYVDDSSDCNDVDPSLNTNDVDGDTETSCGTDCDDGDSNINTSGQEVCDGDGLDEDCDGFVNEDDTVDVGNGVAVDEGSLLTYYLDTDDDGYGNNDESITGCSAPDGYVAEGGDCLDSDDTVYPGNLDEELDPTGCYVDNDEDGFGDNNPSEGITAGTDCDDSESGSSNYPGADEYCDGVNNNCDAEGSIDEDAVDAIAWFVDADLDGEGVPYAEGETPVMACSDAQPDATETHAYSMFDTDCDDTDASVNQDTVWYYDADEDNYGGTLQTTSCEQPDGYVKQGGDCLDTNGDVFPGNLSSEADPTGCYIDSDGDGYGDNAPSNAKIDAGTDCNDDSVQYSPVVSWYKDLDGDGYAGLTYNVSSGTWASNSVVTCPTSGTVFDPTGKVFIADLETYIWDCNDGSDEVGPEQTEICSDGINNGCAVDADGFPYLDSAWVSSGNDDGLDTDGDGFTTCQNDCNDTNDQVYPNAASKEEVGLCGADVDGDGYAPISLGGSDCDDTNPDVNTLEGIEIYNNGIDENCDGIDVQIMVGGSGEAAFSAGDLVITEIMHDPLDNFKQKQYLEIYNASGFSVNLAGLQLVDGKGGVHTIDNGGDIILAPEAYFLFVPSIGNSRIQSVIDGSVDFYQYDVLEFNIQRDAGSVAIHDPSDGGVDVDVVSYSAAQGFSYEVGKSIVSPYMVTNNQNDSANAWCVSTTAIPTSDSSTSYGTPGYANDACVSLAAFDLLKTDNDGDGYAELDGDCDDANAGESLASNSFYLDADDDGFGATDAAEILVCNNADTTGYANNNTDCNDVYSGAFPEGVDLELCDLYIDSTDYNCDGVTETSAPRCDLDTTNTFSISGSVSEYFANGLARQIPDITGDGIDDVIVAAHQVTGDTASNDYNRGKLYFYAGPLTDSSTPYMTWSGESKGGLFGFQDANVGDVNNDGYNDIVVGAHATATYGKVYVFPGDADGFDSGTLDLSVDPLPANVSVILGDTEYRLLGWEAEVVGDVNGDDANDLAIVSRKVSTKNDGALHIFQGGASVFPTDVGVSYDLSSENKLITITGETALQQEFATSVIAMGDLNGDGFDDIAAIEQKTIPSNSSSDVYIYYGAETLNWTYESPDIRIQNQFDIDGDGDDDYRNFKSNSITNVGDIDGDGVNDLAIASGTNIRIIDDATNFDADGDGMSDNFEKSKAIDPDAASATTDLDPSGDIDGDGISNLDEFQQSIEGFGIVVIHNNLGDSSISVRNTYLDAHTILYNPQPDQPEFSFGHSFESGDLDGDGHTDYLVGGKFASTGTNLEEGALYVYYGPLMGSYDSAHGFINGSGIKDYSRLQINGLYSNNGVTQMLLVAPDIADGTGAGKDSTDVGTIYVMDPASIDISQ